MFKHFVVFLNQIHSKAAGIDRKDLNKNINNETTTTNVQCKW